MTVCSRWSLFVVAAFVRDFSTACWVIGVLPDEGARQARGDLHLSAPEKPMWFSEMDSLTFSGNEGISAGARLGNCLPDGKAYISYLGFGSRVI